MNMSLKKAGFQHRYASWTEAPKLFSISIAEWAALYSV